MKIKNLLPIYIFVILSMAGWQGCTKTEVQKGTIDFGMNPLVEEALKSAEVNHGQVVGALVTILGEDGAIVYDKHFLNFYSFGESFVTERLSLEPGQYTLEEFLLLDSMNNILWATPLEGSQLAYMVEDPLPMYFNIEANNTTHLHPQVVWVGNHHPGDFGYVTFEVEFVEKFCIGVEYISSCYDWYMDSIADPNGNIAPYYPGQFLVFGGEKLILDAPLMPGFNTMYIPRGFEKYTIVVIDCGEQKCFSEVFNATELFRFSCAAGVPLTVNCDQPPNDIVITPEDIREPTIDQGVFGRLSMVFEDSTYYEDLNTWPMIRDVYLYKIDDNALISDLIEYDDCVVWPIFDSLPDVIVRSNSSGYYQTKLEAGTYLYMIQTDYGFYIDMYLSSRIPGLLKIEEGEVTIMDIVIYPCYWAVYSE